MCKYKNFKYLYKESSMKFMLLFILVVSIFLKIIGLL